MSLILEISTAPDVDAHGQVKTPPRLLAKLELHPPENMELDQNVAQDLRNQLVNIAANFALGPGEVVQ